MNSPFSSAQRPESGLNFVKPGDHSTILARLIWEKPKGKSERYRADFIVEASEVYKPGTVLTQFFCPHANHYVGAGDHEMGRLLALLEALLNKGLGIEEADTTLTKGVLPEQPLKGLRVLLKGAYAIDKEGEIKLTTKGRTAQKNGITDLEEFMIVNVKSIPIQNTLDTQAHGRQIVTANKKYADTTPVAPVNGVGEIAPAPVAVAAPAPVAVAAPAPAPAPAPVAVAAPAPVAVGTLPTS